MELFLRELSHIIFDELRLKVVPFYSLKTDLPTISTKFIRGQKPSHRELHPYFFFLIQYNDYLATNGMTGKIIIDEGDDNFKEFLSEQKKQEPCRVFDLFSHINMSNDEMHNCARDSRVDNAIQIADLFAYTISSFHAFLHAEGTGEGDRRGTVSVPKESFDELLKRIKGKRYFPLPIERLEESYVKRPENCHIVNLRMCGDRGTTSQLKHYSNND